MIGWGFISSQKKHALSSVACSGLILIEAPSPADRRGMLKMGKNLVTKKEETSMRFYNTQHPFYCGIDLHEEHSVILTPHREPFYNREMMFRLSPIGKDSPWDRLR
jgi:hypothetical protein